MKDLKLEQFTELNDAEMLEVNGGCGWWDSFCAWVRSLFDSQSSGTIIGSGIRG